MTKREKTGLTDARRKSFLGPLCGPASEKGVVLVVVLVLAAIALTLMTTLIYMITTGTQISGFEKRYKTAVEAGQGGADIFYQFIGKRGESVGQTTLQTTLNGHGLNVDIPLNSSCTSSAVSGSGFAVKMTAPSKQWGSNCDSKVAIVTGVTGTNVSYDMRLDLGTYRVYAKVTGASEGNSSGDEDLMTQGVVSNNTGEVTVMSRPYLYAIEIESQNVANLKERARLSILYQY